MDYGSKMLLFLLGSLIGVGVALPCATSPSMNPPSKVSSNPGGFVPKRECKQPQQSKLTNTPSHPTSLKIDPQQGQKPIKGSMSTSSINNNHRQGFIRYLLHQVMYIST